MRAMVLRRPKTPLVSMEVPEPIAGEGKVLVRIKACVVCRTDLRVVDAAGASFTGERRNACVRRHSRERYSEFSKRIALAGARDLFSREPDSA